MAKGPLSDLAVLLDQLELALKQANLWAQEPPELAAFASQLPFCVDTMVVQTWLQFVFIPTLRQCIKQQLALPSRCNITPMVEENLSAKLDSLVAIGRITTEIDEFLR
ncbi:YqcC family protein [Simiduia curdlanivorans]|uniref:YqcC family protein n=1 Tax=Simiduia curdlanivorans TaxID=1492769 RepID=A0ABV8UZP3_9GAMM|nr:YqcC family protein [Simiduia curdlanivorans]MDN3639138.1 YqcC family protein [Simiduia curdlanivorans]